MRNSHKLFLGKLLTGAAGVLLALLIGISSSHDAQAMTVAGPPANTKPATNQVAYTQSEAAGLSWVYYKYVGGAGDVSVPISYTFSSGSVTVPNYCREYGGFWLLTYNAHRAGHSGNVGNYYGYPAGAARLNVLSGYGGTGVYKIPYEGSEMIGPTDPAAGVASVKAMYYESDLKDLEGKFNDIITRDPEVAKDINGVTHKFEPGSALSAFCYPDGDLPEEQEGRFSTRSSVTYDGETSAPVVNGTSEYNSGREIVISDDNITTATVTFQHDLLVFGLVGSIKNNNPNLKVTISTDAQNFAAANGDVQNKLFTTHAGSWSNIDVHGENAKLRKAIYKQTETITLPTRDGESKKYCSKVTYSPTKFSIVTVGDEKTVSYTAGNRSSRACITFKRQTTEEAPEIPVSGTANYGNTSAAVMVTNYTNGTSATTSAGEDTSANTVAIYAKPGDSVQFAHTLSFGAQAVQADNWSGVLQQNWFKISASPGSHLFGNNASLGRQVYLDRGAVTYAGADQSANYSMTIFSPNNTAGNNYSCFANTNFRLSYVRPAYQVTGFSQDYSLTNCNNATLVEKAGNTYDAGRVFAQSLEWNNVKSWVNSRIVRYGGSCSCNNSGAYAENASINSYEEATRSSNFGKLTYQCYASGSGCARCGTSPYDYPCGTQYSLDNYTERPMTSTSEVGATKTAEVWVPYNFNTTASSSISNGGSSGVVYAGQSATFTVSTAITARNNPLVDNTAAYATVTPADTDVMVVNFTIGSNVASTANLSGGVVSESPCVHFFNSIAEVQCNIVYVERKSYNASGNLSGDTAYSQQFTTAVPDMEVGTKFCVAVGISHADSHGLADVELTAANGANAASMGSTSSKWRISGASCRTIAKKPNFQVWGAGIYSEQGIVAATSPKNLAVTSIAAATEANAGASKLFGSWAEYGLVSPSQVTGFATAAALGYGPAGQGSDSGHTYTNNYCEFTHLSIANTACSSNAGQAQVLADNTTLLARIKARYTDDSAPANQPGPYLDLTRAAVWDNGVVYAKAAGNLVVNQPVVWGGSADYASNNTLVIDVAGTLYIDHNLCYGAGTCASEDGALVLAQRNNSEFSEVATLPQIIVRARNIEVSAGVSQIDAWLIAEASGVSGGVLNTCNNFTVGSTDANGCNKTLIFNGPVFTRELLLNRTAGAGVGQGASTGIYSRDLAADGSVTPAEIFNLRPDAVYWAYNQASRFSQAVVTYTRELAPRY